MPNLRGLKSRIPWWGKLLGQVLISRLPVTYQFWHRLGVLGYGYMDDPSYAYGVFTKHFGRVQFGRRSTGWVGLELGPGDSVASAVIAHAYGAVAYYLIDAGDFAQNDLKIYRNMSAFLVEKGLPAASLNHVTSVEDVLKSCNATYGTAGLASLRAIPTGSVDFIWSHTALQHVRRTQFFETLLELRRILRHDGASSHVIDLTDQLATALNHLRFRESIWESSAIAKCGSYVNRFRYSEMLTMFRKAGFKVGIVAVMRWDQLPTPRRKLDPQFQAFSDEDLRVLGFDVVLSPA